MQRRTFVANLAVAIAAASVLPLVSARAVRAHAKPRTLTVRIADFVFAPDTVGVHAGDTIRWVNNDIVPHTATADDESWDTGEIKPREMREIKVTAGMTQAYFCRFHPAMKAALRIT